MIENRSILKLHNQKNSHYKIDCRSSNLKQYLVGLGKYCHNNNNTMQACERRLKRCMRHLEHQSCCGFFCRACSGKFPTLAGIVFLPIAASAIILSISQSSQLQGQFQAYQNSIASEDSCRTYCDPRHSFLSGSGQCCLQNGKDCHTKNECYMQNLMFYGIIIITMTIYVLLYLSYYAIKFMACLERYLRPQVAPQENNIEEEALQQGLIGRRAANPVLARLPASQSYKNSEELCSICLGAYEGNKAIRLRCQHIFHEGCIRKWMECNSKCPLCRTVQ